MAEAVRALQFEDIATQSLGAATLHLERLMEINREATALHELLHRGIDDSEMQQALRKLLGRIGQLRAEWERPPHKPVAQQSMDAGSVELF